jgi:hypothetical protein
MFLALARTGTPFGRQRAGVDDGGRDGDRRDHADGATAPSCRKATAILVQHGEPIRRLQVLAGHVTGAFTLQRYTHYYASAQRTVEAISHILPAEQP